MYLNILNLKDDPLLDYVSNKKCLECSAYLFNLKIIDTILSNLRIKLIFLKTFYGQNHQIGFKLSFYRKMMYTFTKEYGPKATRLFSCEL